MQTSHALPKSQFSDAAPSLTRVRLAPLEKAVPQVAGNNDIPPGVYGIAILCWGALLAEFWITFFVSSHALFMVAVSTVYAVVFFGIPLILSRMQGPDRTSPALTLAAFARGRFNTLYGPISGFGAMLQVFLVPLILSVGGVAFGFIIHAARIAH